jgi:hypothetical protein
MDNSTVADEAVGLEEVLDVRFWHQAVLESFHGKCASCGSDHKVSPRLVISEALGGKKTLSNSTLWCRACEMVADTFPKKGEEDRRIVNIWVSRSLYDRLHRSKEAGHIASVGSLVRSLIEGYVSNEARYDDLAQYQDEGTDVRLNVWVDQALYGKFKDVTDRNGLTVTSALKSLFCMYESETSTRFDGAALKE